MTPPRILPLLVGLAGAGCAVEAERLDAPRVVSGVAIAPYGIHQECLALASGERIGYRFNAQQPVAFNVHFHEGNTVIMPVDVKATIEESGDFTADRKQTYCLTWEAGPLGSMLEYRVLPLR